jgi:hypothetical protein
MPVTTLPSSLGVRSGTASLRGSLHPHLLAQRCLTVVGMSVGLFRDAWRWVLILPKLTGWHHWLSRQVGMTPLSDAKVLGSIPVRPSYLCPIRVGKKEKVWKQPAD